MSAIQARKGRDIVEPGPCMTALRTLPFVLALALAAPTARAAVAGGTLPDGTYHCEVYLLGDFLSLGDIAIKGSVYSGPSFGLPRTAMPAYNYQIDPNGEIAWLGPVGGFTQGGNAIALTQVTAGGPANASFDIIMRQASGEHTAATCTIKPPAQ